MVARALRMTWQFLRSALGRHPAGTGDLEPVENRRVEGQFQKVFGSALRGFARCKTARPPRIRNYDVWGYSSQLQIALCAAWAAFVDHSLCAGSSQSAVLGKVSRGAANDQNS